ncbi:hypothetical protein CUZ56_03009 [Saezia sanguinis]|jgi:uncharacterized protein (TIGR00730 family)|uniref:Cytokinin riboside 5'-monophosphate phosphoribohydrolase n=1 Tax=Saezia sanguinis TaxID=1965230 RepID=A0A433S9L2_9BURK|nr:TIGR00730 family Rossman fold protein [Saezia sanguinis]RUS65428.1 hypothetical protein CUZ56_03009 [Saezia sanguinis]
MNANLHLLNTKSTIAARDIVDPRKELEDPPAFRLAFSDGDFLLRDETRGVRFQLELLKADLILKEHNVNSTIVIFGSARLRSREAATQLLRDAEHQLSLAPQDSASQLQLKRAQKLLADSCYYEDARIIGQMIGAYEQAAPQDRKVFVCTGGGPGIMEAANRGASESGSPNIGLNIVLPHEQKFNPYITPELCLRFHYFATRKMHFMMRARALIAFPGGFGTLDELFEMLTLIQTHKSRPVPVVLYGTSFWKQLINFEMLLDMEMISPEDVDLFQFVDSPVEAWNAVRFWYDLPVEG